MDQNLWTGLMQAQMQAPQQAPQQSFQGLMASPQQQNPYGVPTLWPQPPGQQPLQVVPPWARDQMDRQAMMNGYDRNAVQGDDVMRQYFVPRGLGQEDI